MVKVGDEIFLEQCWEDTTGAYHGEPARVLSIDDPEDVKLDFFEASDEVKKFLAGCNFTLEEIESQNS